MKLPRALNAAAAAAVQVTVHPAPPSTTYSSKILQQLQTFGQLHYFKAVAHSTSGSSTSTSSQTYRAVFDSSEAAAKALDASPLTVHAFDKVPSATVLDPFNVFGWQQRKHPPKRTFTCELAAAEDTHEALLPNSARVLVTHEHTPSLRHSLVEAQAPLSLVDGLSTRLHTVTTKAGHSTENQARWTGADKGEEEKLAVPWIRKYVMGPRLRKVWSKSSTDT